jgi:23S rRNA pseudouridine2605 synthase
LWKLLKTETSISDLRTQIPLKQNSNQLERLSKYLARSGIASRRHAEEIIRQGRVMVNGTQASQPQHKISPGADLVTVDGLPVKQHAEPVYIALYKPVGCLSDLKDPRGRKLARELIAEEGLLFPVGRLDFASEGLMLFTNDGEVANRLMHPRYGSEKEYLVKLRGSLCKDDMQAMRDGIYSDGEILKVKSIALISQAGTNHWYSIVLVEGRNRIIRRLADAVYHPVLRLKRVRISNLRLGRMRAGQYRRLSPNEIESLREERDQS